MVAMIQRETYWSQAKDAASHLGSKGAYPVDIAIQCGSGLSELASMLGSGAIRIPMDEIPHFPAATVTGHGKEAVFAKVGKHNVLVLSGRIHMYEGNEPHIAGFPAAMAAAAGAKLFVVTNAAGGLNQHFRTGEVMVHRDFINFQHCNALEYIKAHTAAERFIDPKPAYNKPASASLANHLASAGMKVNEGVYIAVRGPIFESQAELAMMRSFGADAIGMSTVPEVTICHAFGLPVVGVSAITNECFGSVETDHADVLKQGQLVAGKITAGLESFIASSEWLG